MTDLLVIVVLGTVLLLLLAVIARRKIETTKRGSIDTQFVKNKWAEIEAMAAKRDQGARYAVIEADKLLDYALKKRGYAGDTMGERLKTVGRDLSDLDGTWSAHKLRNRLVHETQYKVNQANIKTAVRSFRQALKDLRAL